METSLDFLDGTSASEREQLRESFTNQGVAIQSVHLPFKDPHLDDLASLYETDQQRAVDNTKHWIDTAVSVGATTGRAVAFLI